MKKQSASAGLHTPVQWGALHLGLIWIYRGAVGSMGRGWQELSQNPSAWYFLKGSGYVETERGTRVSAREGQWLVARPARRFQHFSKDARILSIRFRAQWPDGRHLFDEGLSVSVEGREHPALLREARKLEQVARSGTRHQFDTIGLRDCAMGLETFLDIERQFLRWLLEFYRTLTVTGLRPHRFEQDDERLRRAIERVQRWPLERRYSVEEMARSAGVGARQLERLFVQSLGVTSKRFLDNRRLQFAQEHLEGRMLSVKEVAFRTGFSHVPSFCRWYRKLTGHAPSVLTVQ